MTPDQTREVAKALLDVASALQRAAAALADEPAAPDVFTRCTYRSPFGGQCVLPWHGGDVMHSCEGGPA